MEEILNKSIEMQKQGLTDEEILKHFKNSENELLPFLSINKQLLGIPKNTVPTPVMQRKYAMAKSPSLWFLWIRISRFSMVSMGMFLLFVLFALTTYKASQSSPGQKLFTVKKSTEQLRLILTYGSEAKTNLQIQIAKNRLEEARSIFNDPQSGLEEKQAALSELTNQTNTAVTEVKKLTQKNLKSEKNPALLESLDGITQNQVNLLAEIKLEDNQIQTATDNAMAALNQNTEKISEIKNSVAIATQENILAKLAENPNSVGVLGEIAKISEKQIVVEKTVFTIDSQTIFKDEAGKFAQPNDFKIKIKVNIIGEKSFGAILAKEVRMVNGVLKPENEQTNKDITGIKEKEIVTTESNQLTPINPDTNPNDPNQATGTFIMEDPAPQFENN